MKKLSCSGYIHPFFLLIIIILVAIPMGFYGMYLYIAPSLPEMSSLKKAPLLKPLQVYSADNQLIAEYGGKLSVPVEYKNIPQNGGVWSGEPGNSKWIPNKEDIPKQPYGNEKTWATILEEHGIDGIEFKEGEPDFTPVAEGSVEIEDFTTNRDDNFFQADQNLAQKWNQESKNGKNDWSISDIRQYRKEKKLTWHERSDMKTLDLVPQEVHGNVPHAGGISALKNS